MSKVTFHKSSNRWIADLGNSKAYYSVNKYGKHAKKMAEYSAANGVKINNYFEIKDDYVILYSFNKKFNEYKEILVDLDDFNKIKNYYWSCKEDKHTFYGETFIDRHTRLYLHRLIMNPERSNQMVDHINGNGLDNRKSNLRIVNNEINQKNLNNPVRNKVGHNGVHEDKERFRAIWSINGKTYRKSFSKSKYGYEEAFKLACEYRDKMANEDNGYIK